MAFWVQTSACSSCHPAWPDVSWFTQKQQLRAVFTIALALKNTSKCSHWSHTDLLPPFSLALPQRPKFAAPGCKRHKVREAQEDTINLYLGTIIEEPFLSEKCIDKNTHTGSSAWPWNRRYPKGSWFWNSWQELMPLPSLSCCQTTKASSDISTQNVRNILFFFSQSCQSECQQRRGRGWRAGDRQRRKQR